MSVHGPFRVATEKTLFAMPETAIGAYTVHAYHVHVQQYVKLAKQLGLAHMHIVNSFWWYKFDAANHVKCHIVCIYEMYKYVCLYTGLQTFTCTFRLQVFLQMWVGRTFYHVLKII